MVERAQKNASSALNQSRTHPFLSEMEDCLRLDKWVNVTERKADLMLFYKPLSFTINNVSIYQGRWSISANVFYHKVQNWCSSQHLELLTNSTRTETIGVRFWSRGISTKKCIKLYVLHQKAQHLHKHSVCPAQMVNLVISQQLGKWERTQGFIKKCLLHSAWRRFWWNCLSLLCYAMCSASRSVVCERPTANLCLWVLWGGWFSQKTQERGSGRQTLKREEREGQRETEEGSYLRCSLPTSH